MSATPSPCPICGSDFCCCLEHLFPDLGNEPFRKKAGACHETGGDEPGHRRYEPGQAEPLHGAYQQGQAFTELENGSLLEGVATGHASVSALSLLPKGAGPGRTTVSCDYPSPQEYQQALELARDLAAHAEPTPDRTSLGQSQRASLLEAASNILIGFWVSVGANMLVLPHFKNPGVFSEAFLIGLIFTIISFCRSYLLRRLFNLFHIRQNRRSPWKP